MIKSQLLYTQTYMDILTTKRRRRRKKKSIIPYNSWVHTVLAKLKD